MREKLIELFFDYQEKYNSLVPSKDGLADHLLANGVIVLPCKVGDTVYAINDWEVEQTTVSLMEIESKGNQWVIFLWASVEDHGIKFKDGYGCMFKIFVFGKTVFLTREEAEAALKEGKG